MSYLMPRDVCTQFGVSDETLRRWAVEAKIDYITLPSGHRQYPASEVERLLIQGRVKSERKLQTTQS